MKDWYQIESNSFIIQVTSLGAEMKRLFSKQWHRELLWLGDEKVWNRSAPVLFPIVGALKDGRYSVNGKTYELSQHGFARDFDFKCLECGLSEVTFELQASPESYSKYPFCFNLKINYKLSDDKLTVSYFVKNEDRQTIYFSIGAHPAFETQTPDDYEILFEQVEKEYYKLNQGLADWSKPIVLQTNSLRPTTELFAQDALIFKKLKSTYVELIDHQRREVIRVSSNAPYFGIWAKEKIPFICLEPWHGVSDDAAHDGQLEKKKGIIKLLQGAEFVFSYSVETRLLETV